MRCFSAVAELLVVAADTNREFGIVIKVDEGTDGQLGLSFNVEPARPYQCGLHRVLDLAPTTFKRAGKVTR